MTMTLIVISVDREKLPAHTDQEFEEFVRFQFGDRGGISASNPLNNMDMEAEVKEIG